MPQRDDTAVKVPECHKDVIVMWGGVQKRGATAPLVYAESQEGSYIPIIRVAITWSVDIDRDPAIK